MTAIECPTCGSTFWHRIVGGNYTAEQNIDTSAEALASPFGVEIQEEEIWTDVMEVQTWKCQNDHAADDETSDAIEEAQE